jgi:hypothetical protein
MAGFATPTGNHRAAAATMRGSFVTCEDYRNGSLRQLNTRTIRRSGENNGLDAVVASPFPHSEIGVFYLVMPAGMLRCHEVHDPEYASVEARTGAHMLVVGTGALGSMVAAYVRRAGETVPVLARGACASYLRLCGVAECTGPCTVVTDPRTVQEVWIPWQWRSKPTIRRKLSQGFVTCGHSVSFPCRTGCSRTSNSPARSGPRNPSTRRACVRVRCVPVGQCALRRSASAPSGHGPGRRSPRPRSWGTRCATPACRRGMLHAFIPSHGRNLSAGWGFPPGGLDPFGDLHISQQTAYSAGQRPGDASSRATRRCPGVPWKIAPMHIKLSTPRKLLWHYRVATPTIMPASKELPYDDHTTGGPCPA